jgi:hypothetical protein
MPAKGSLRLAHLAKAKPSKSVVGARRHTCGDELIDDALRIVDKVAELGLEDGEAAAFVAQRVAILKAQHACLAQRGVPHLHALLHPRLYAVQRHPPVMQECKQLSTT